MDLAKSAIPTVNSQSEDFVGKNGNTMDDTTFTKASE